MATGRFLPSSRTAFPHWINSFNTSPTIAHPRFLSNILEAKFRPSNSKKGKFCVRAICLSIFYWTYLNVIGTSWNDLVVLRGTSRWFSNATVKKKSNYFNSGFLNPGFCKGAGMGMRRNRNGKLKAGIHQISNAARSLLVVFNILSVPQ
jgi:hypothetical protein